MAALTASRPKCLVELHGRPLLEWQLSAMRHAGIQEIGIVTGYRREQIQPWGLHEFINAEWEKTNMVSSLLCAEPWLKSEPCIVSYSDIFYGQAAIRALRESDAQLAVTFDPNWLALWTSRFGNPLLDAETFRFNANGNLTEIGNRPTSVEEVQGQYMGLLLFTPIAWQEIKRVLASVAPGSIESMHMTGLLQKVIDAQRLPIAAIPYAGTWGEIDNEADLKLYSEREIPNL